MNVVGTYIQAPAIWPVVSFETIFHHAIAKGDRCCHSSCSQHSRLPALVYRLFLSVEEGNVTTAAAAIGRSTFEEITR